MTTISVPLDAQSKRNLERLEKSNPEMSRAGIVRKAIRKMSEEEAIQAVLEAERDIARGRVFKGDLRTLLKRHQMGTL
ncbi:MAG: hypothetical protein AAB421_05295 [Patescibacteria group bacterium]